MDKSGFASTVKMPEPLIILHVSYNYKENKIELQPSLKEIDSRLKEMTLSCADVISDVKSCEFEMVATCNMPESFLYSISRGTPIVEEAAKVVSETVH